MNTIKKLLYNLAVFMSKRYSRLDALGISVFVLAFIINIASIFIDNVPVIVAMYVLRLALLIWFVFRFFSKNVWKRYEENRKYKLIWKRVGAWFVLLYRRFRYGKTSVFRRCPHCKAQLKLPHKRGKHSVCCPRCREKFKVNIIL